MLYGKVAVRPPAPVTHIPNAAVPAVMVVGVAAPLATAGIWAQVAPLSLLRPEQAVELVVLTRMVTPPEALVESFV